MAIPEKDRKILRDLAKQCAEIAVLPVQQEKRELWRKLNGLERVRPIVRLYEGEVWYEIPDKIKLETETEFARGEEVKLRQALYHWAHLRDDSIFGDDITCSLVLKHSGWGIDVKATHPESGSGAVCYNSILEDDADPSMIQMPKLSVDWAATEINYQRMGEIYDGILKVVKRGQGYLGFAMVDQLIQWRGINKFFTDMLDRPEWHMSKLDQYEQQNLLLLNNNDCQVGSGGIGMMDELPQPDFDGTHIRLKDLWGHAATRIFSEVSPTMHEEFALKYEKQLLARFGLASYGCCEPLDNKIDIITQALPNLRRLSMSPWVDVARGAEELGNKYVFSYRPNPALFGMEQWNLELTRQQLKDDLDKMRGCCVEVIMIAVQTCHQEPQRLWSWTKMTMETVEDYA